MSFSWEQGREQDRRRLWIIRPIVDEISEELATMPQDRLAYYWENIGLLFQWIGTGDDTKMPEELREFVARVEGREYIPMNEPDPNQPALIAASEVLAEVIHG